MGTIRGLVPSGNKGIKEIKLSNVASYGANIQSLNPKKYTYIYGLNGTGKSTISRYLSDRTHSDFSGCKIDFDGADSKYSIFVYNEDYVRDVFYENDSLKGIFTLGEGNADAQKAIDKAETEIKSLNRNLEEETNRTEELVNTKNKATEEIEGLLWDRYRAPHRVTSLRHCMTGIGSSKSSFMTAVLNSSVIELAENETATAMIEELESELSKLISEDAQELPIIDKQSFSKFTTIEGHGEWGTSIVNSSDGYLSSIIEQLSNESWIKIGIDNYLSQTDSCPFCARDMGENLKLQIQSHFDKAYQLSCQKIKEYKDDYEFYYHSLKEFVTNLKTNSYISSQKGFDILSKEIETVILQNKEEIAKKVNDPRIITNLSPTNDLIETLNSFIDKANEEIISFNKRLETIGSAKKESQDRFLKLVKTGESSAIKLYEESLKGFDIKEKAVKLSVTKILKDIEAQNVIIKENQKKTKNIKDSVDWINAQLKYIGVDGFFIAEAPEHGESFYKLSRPEVSSANPVFKSLSEGEKTIISFLYFVKSCLGGSEAVQIDLSKRIIVVDDPISSLSFNYVFEIASLVSREFLSGKNNFCQVITLSHHLYFMHELFRQMRLESNKKIKEKTSLLRLVKSNGVSEIKEMEAGEIKNKYESYWQFIKDIDSSEMNKHMLPNIMRNILEHFFSFMSKDEDWKLTLRSMANDYDTPCFKAFERYLDKGSHSDSVTFVDDTDINIEKFIYYLSQVFERNGYQEHFVKMMGGDSSRFLSPTAPMSDSPSANVHEIN